MPTLTTTGEHNSVDNNNVQSPQIANNPTETQSAAAAATKAVSTTEKPRRRKCPSKDTILISVPLHVTADLGVAIRRTRKKRENRIKRWLAQETAGEETKQQPMIANNNGNDSRQKDGKADENDGEELLASDDDDDEGRPIISKEQYGSVLDYLEAKYVRGVSIAQYNSHGERVKKVKNNNNSNNQQSNKDDQDDDDEELMYDSDQDNNRSVYGDNDGFIDDSMLQEEIVDQVFASDSYGKTKIEMEAKRRRKEHIEGNNKENDEEEKEQDFSEVESDFDDGFFVNIGDLEMEEGWRGDEDVIMSPVKRKPGRPKKSESDQVDVIKPKAKKRKVDKDSTSSEKKKKKVDKTTKNKDVGSDGKAKIAKKKKAETSTAEKKLSPAKTSTPKKSPKPKDEPQTPKSIMNNLAKQVKRKLNICIKQINELSPKHLPRKQRQKVTTKTTISIPEGKGVGDTIMFE